MISLENVLSVIPFYLLGCFPTGVLVAKLYGVSIAQKGSGNVGATNVARVIGKKAGIITLLGDALKGVLGVLIAQQVFSSEALISAAGFCVVLGHCLSLPPLLKGGKGVATSIGALSILSPSSALTALIIFLLFFLVSKIVSLSSILAAGAAALFAFCSNLSEERILAIMLIAFLVAVRHHENISRLLAGTESKFKLPGKR